MATDIPNLGEFASKDAQQDAIHIAVVPMIAAGDLEPGDHVRILDGTEDMVTSAYNYESEKLVGAIGVVDPFLASHYGYQRGIQRGDRIWVLLYPNAITSLRHTWTHPAFERAKVLAGTASESEKWLRAFADRWCMDYSSMVKYARRGDGEVVLARGRNLHNVDDLGEDLAPFWYHMEKLTGENFDSMHRNSVIWSCMC